MTVKIRTFRSGGLEVDIRFTYPDGSTFRRRFKAPVEGKTAARRWGEAREAELLKAPSPKERAEQEHANREVPTLRDFGPRYIENHALADQLKASTVDWIEKTYRNNLNPELGDKRLDEIDDEDVQRLKARLTDRNRKTVNNVLGILGHTRYNKSRTAIRQTASGKSELAALVARFPLPWSQYVLLLHRGRSPEARAFYETEALRGGWTVRQLHRQIDTQFYERTALSRNRLDPVVQRSDRSTTTSLNWSTGAMSV